VRWTLDLRRQKQVAELKQPLQQPQQQLQRHPQQQPPPPAPQQAAAAASSSQQQKLGRGATGHFKKTVNSRQRQTLNGFSGFVSQSFKLTFGFILS